MPEYLCPCPQVQKDKCSRVQALRWRCICVFCSSQLWSIAASRDLTDASEGLHSGPWCCRGDRLLSAFPYWWTFTFLKYFLSFATVNIFVHLFPLVVHCSVGQLCPLFTIPWTAAHQAPLSATISQSLFKFMSIALVMLSNHLILCHPLLLLSSIFANMRVFPNKLVLRIRWPKYWSFSFSTSPSNEYAGLISFRIGWFDLLAIQGT